MSPKIVLCLGLFVVLACDRTSAVNSAPRVAAPAAEAAAKDGAPDAQPKTPAAAAAEPTPKHPTGLGATVDAAAERARRQAEAANDTETPAPTGVATDPRWPPSAPILKAGAVEIPASAVMDIYALKAQKYTERGRAMPETAARRYRSSIVQRIAYQELLRQEAARLGVDYDKAALAAREAQQRRGIRDWPKHLDRRGETDESLRAMFRAELREVAVLDSSGGLAVTPAEIEADYEKIRGNWRASEPRVRASHILIPITTSDADAKRAAEDAYAEAIKPGADFAELAKRLSSGPSADKGGDIGIFTHDRMAEEFSDAAFAVKAGAITTPVKTKFGFHVIKVTGRWPAGDLPIAALEDQIRERLKQRKLHHGRRELKQRLFTGSGATTWMDFETGARLAKPAAIEF